MADSFVTQALAAWDEHRKSDDREQNQVRKVVRERAAALMGQVMGIQTTASSWNVRGTVATYKVEGIELQVDTADEEDVVYGKRPAGSPHFYLRAEGAKPEDEWFRVDSLQDVGKLLEKGTVVPATPAAKAKVSRRKRA